MLWLNWKKKCSGIYMKSLALDKFKVVCHLCPFLVQKALMLLTWVIGTLQCILPEFDLGLQNVQKHSALQNVAVCASICPFYFFASQLGWLTIGHSRCCLSPISPTWHELGYWEIPFLQLFLPILSGCWLKECHLVETENVSFWSPCLPFGTTFLQDWVGLKLIWHLEGP